MKNNGAIIGVIVVAVIIGLTVYAQSRFDTCKRRGDKSMECVLGL